MLILRGLMEKTVPPFTVGVLEKMQKCLGCLKRRMKVKFQGVNNVQVYVYTYHKYGIKKSIKLRALLLNCLILQQKININIDA